MRFLTEDRDRDRTTQNCGISVEGEHKSEIIDFFGVLHEVIELRYSGLRRIVLFKCRWYDLGRHRPIVIDPQLVNVHTGHVWYESDPYIFAKQARLVWYIEDNKMKEPWRVAIRAQHRYLFNPVLFTCPNNEGPENEVHATIENEDIKYKHQITY